MHCAAVHRQKRDNWKHELVEKAFRDSGHRPGIHSRTRVIDISYVQRLVEFVPSIKNNHGLLRDRRTDGQRGL